MSDPLSTVMDTEWREAGTHPCTHGFLPGQSDVSELARSDVHSEETEWSGPQGSTLGLLEYVSQSNDNTRSIEPELKYKWQDDLSVKDVHVRIS